MPKTLWMESSEFVYVLCICKIIFKKNLQHISKLNMEKSLHRNATVVIEARQVVMKIFEDYTQSWYWILM